ncbi:DsbA family oxidoreductase [Rhodococcus rhodnii]|uniref:DsbA family oxidoreductase n=1 Tax=Rhodococcus rhodnii TaxID=38312 RepID=A0A6P2CIZ9_9NOCA|nr:DsbA family oxidoreductase [Rhodococcus rhodnii]
MHVEIWSDIACPWCYIGKARFQSALEQFEGRDRVDVTWRAYQLMADTPVGEGRREVDALVESKGMSREQVLSMFDHVAKTGADVGLTLDFEKAIAANTFDAHRVVQLAGDRAGEVVDGLFRAHFAQGLAVDDRDVLLDVATEAGLERDVVAKQLASEDGADAVRSDLAAARELQIGGVPFFVGNRRVAVSGAQPEDVFLQLLAQA